VSNAILNENAILNVDALLAPIPGDDPAGDERAYAHGLRDELIELRREERTEDFDDDMRPSELKRSDWQGVIQTATTALESTTKHLRVACHLIEAVTQLHGFPGLSAGLQLLRRMVDECWDRLYPAIEDGDLDSRAAPLVNMLDDAQRGVCFPLTIQTIPLIGSGSNRYGLIEWQRAKQSHNPQVEELLARAAIDTPFTELEATVDAIHDCQQQIELLLSVLDEKLGSESPSLTHLRDAISQCDHLVREGFLQSTQPVVAGPRSDSTHAQTHRSSLNTPSTGTATSTATSTEQALITRSDAYNQLKRAAETLQKLEPHSPIPYLVQRAVRLGRLPFPQLIEKLIRDGNVLEELGREFGLSGAGDDGSSSTG